MQGSVPVASLPNAADETLRSGAPVCGNPHKPFLKKRQKLNQFCELPAKQELGTFKMQ
jgi:hypothetical protein